MNTILAASGDSSTEEERLASGPYRVSPYRPRILTPCISPGQREAGNAQAAGGREGEDAGALDEQCVGVASSFATLLGDELALYAIARHYHADDPHWFFGWQCSELQDIVDEIAERAALLGGRDPRRVAPRLKDVAATAHSTAQTVTRATLYDLLAKHQLMVREIRDLEARTAVDQHTDMLDFFSGLVKRHDLMAWMLRVIVSDESGWHECAIRRLNGATATGRHLSVVGELPACEAARSLS